VIEGTNLPARPVLAMHCGNVKRQAALSVNTPLELPKPDGASTMQLSLLSQLNTLTLPQGNGKDGVECSIPVTKLDGQETEVKLRLRDPLCSSTSKTVAPVNQVVAAQEYLAAHNLQSHLQNMIQDVLREQPENPYRYMLGSLKAMRDARKVKVKAEKDEATAPLVPRAPAGPPPESGAPRRARQFAEKVEAKVEEGSTSRVAAVGILAHPRTTTPSNAPLSAREEIKVATRASLNMLFQNPKVAEMTDFDCRSQVQKDLASELAGSVLEKVRERQLSHETPVAAVARTERKNSLLTLPSDHRRCLVKWVVARSFRGAAHRLKAAAENGLKQDAAWPLPIPIVNLDAMRISWADACA